MTNATACEHLDRPVFSKKMCQSCYNADLKSRKESGEYVRRGPEATREGMLCDCSCGCGTRMLIKGAQLEAKRRGRPVFCSREHQASYGFETRQCACGCGNTVTRKSSYFKKLKTDRVFASAECRNRVGSKPKQGWMKPCEMCGEEFWVIPAVAETKRFHSIECKDKWQRRNRIELNCEWCDKIFEVQPSKGETKFCSRECMGESMTAASTGWLTSDGYRQIPMKDRPHGRVLEHVYVFEQLIGRRLVKGEEVHHCNRVRDDNRIDGPPVLVDGKLRSGNLELWSTSQPAGGRVPDVLLWMYEQMGMYAETTDLPQFIARRILAEHGTASERNTYKETESVRKHMGIEGE